jgi:uncharacterized protein (DUF433 family)
MERERGVEPPYQAWEAGVDETDIAENFKLPIEQVKTILLYAASPQNAPIRRT